LIMLAKNYNWDNLYNKPGCHVVSKDFFDIQEHGSHRQIAV